MSLFLIGDIHGRIPQYLKLLASLPPCSRSIALGDMYLVRPGVHLPELLPEDKFLRWNHDDLALCRAHPNYLGDVGTVVEINWHKTTPYNRAQFGGNDW